MANSNNNQRGKLTLDQVYTTYQNSTRGAESAYRFEYSNENPAYSPWKVDRWGNFKAGATSCETMDFPYVHQFDPTMRTWQGKDQFDQDRAREASAWNLTKIDLPQWNIEVEYEADDYGYVQHKAATQMFNIFGLGQSGSNTALPDSRVFDKSSWDENDLTQRRIYFELEEPIPYTNVTAELEALKKTFYDAYLRPIEVDGRPQLYYKIKSKLRDIYEEYISGYANVLQTTDSYGFAENTALIDLDGTGAGACFTKGFITLDFTEVDEEAVEHHPFAFAAWQFMRINAAKLLTAIGSFDEVQGTSEAATEQNVRNLLGWWPQLRQMFTGFRKYAFKREWGSELVLADSYIRLGSPDRKKYGGNMRVKKTDH